MKLYFKSFLVVLVGSVVIFACKPKATYQPDTDPIFKNDAALKEMTEAITKNPEDASLFFARGVALRKMKLDSLALKDLRHATDLDTTKAEYLSYIGDYLFESNDFQNSITWFEKAIAKNPKDPKTHLKIAKLFYYLKEYKKAEEQINMVQRQNVYDPETYFLEGMILKELKDTVHAISRFQTAIEQNPDYKDAIIQLGLLYAAKKDTLAIKYLEKAYKTDSNDVTTIYAKGVYFQQHEDYTKAIEEYKRCILKNSHYINAYFNLGWIYMQQDSMEKSYRQYDIVTKLEPDNPTAYFNRGLCSEILKKPKEAVIDYRRALLLDHNYQSPKKALDRLKVDYKDILNSK